MGLAGEGLAGAGVGLGAAATFLAGMIFLAASAFAATGFNGRLSWVLAGGPLGTADLPGEGLRALTLRAAALLAGFCAALLPLEVFFRAISVVSLATSGCSLSIAHAILFLPRRCVAPVLTPERTHSPGRRRKPPA